MGQFLRPNGISILNRRGIYVKVSGTTVGIRPWTMLSQRQNSQVGRGKLRSGRVRVSVRVGMYGVFKLASDPPHGLPKRPLS